MKSVKHKIIVSVLLLFGVILSVSNGFSATSGFSDDAGGPMGLAIQGNAPGEKLAGVVCLEIYDFGGQTNGFAVVRLRKANILRIFYAEIFDVSLEDMRDIQQKIMTKMGPEIIKEFFVEGADIELVLRNFEEDSTVQGYHGAGTDSPGVDFDYTIADVVIAAK